MVRRLLTFFIALFLLVISHAAKAQQLPDSLLVKHEPMMVLDTSLPVVVAVPGDSIIGTQPISIPPWPIFGGYGEGGPWWPGIYTVTVTEFPVSYTCYFVTVDSTHFIPHADSFLGTKANIVAGKKIPGAAQVSAFGNSARRFTTRTEAK